MSSGPTIPQVRVTVYVLPTIAIVVTLFRLYIRYTRGKLWWDDAWALVSAMLSVIFSVAVVLHVKDPTSLAQNVKIGVYYMCAQFFYAVNWTARVSILFTIIRLSVGNMRRILTFISFLFLIAWLILFAQVWWVCEKEPGWKNATIPQCMLGENVAIAQITVDVISDAILIVAPIRLLWRVHLESSTKIRLMAVFGTTLITTAVSLYHAYVVFRIGGLPEARAATIQTSVSLLVANLSVVIAFIFRLKSDSETENTAPLSITTFGKRGGRPKEPNLFSTIGLGTQDFGVLESTQSNVGVQVSQSTRVDLPGASDTTIIGKFGQTSDDVYQLKTFGSSTASIPEEK
ncbi:uncharacterized protein BT62DRAFT_1079673 [Guyanagaster necrorhizus]|uniref:Rhodopsin domain-containing protein n=1 Tax=Guyanagaster necrorhizus TaxID=856835 RepID=A0A9P8APJ2_9AGAR|nr:uncharacterized protein BT62DRAFT_1079673 [Guyanagaster necrorhizus MCA 3950]KAG7441922.1 hypothetical protein BT62DRAFT_1079673 [Guyanagaster necrorhizus MCA 3950]